MGELINAASACPGWWVGDPCSHVLQPQRVLVEPGDLEDDPPGAREVWDVDLQTTRQAGTRGMLGVAPATLSRVYTLSLVAVAGGRDGSARGLGQTREVGRKQGVVEAGRGTGARTGPAQGCSALAVCR